MEPEILSSPVNLAARAPTVAFVTPTLVHHGSAQMQSHSDGLGTSKGPVTRLDSARNAASPPASAPNSVAEFLTGLNLMEYYSAFLDEGFDRMSSVLEITEEDLSALNVKRGHRRSIQRQIASIKGVPFTATLQIPRRKSVAEGTDAEEPGSSAQDDKPSSSRVTQNNSNVIIFKGKQPAVGDDVEERSKRRYRRHPKADLNAPDKPPSAYVTFSNTVREELKGTKSFSELARIVGERWKTLDPVKKEKLESAAATAKEQYHAALSQYKTTPQYASYQQYLADFKARHGQHDAANKTSAASKSKTVPPLAISPTTISTVVPQKRSASAPEMGRSNESDSDSSGSGSIDSPMPAVPFAGPTGDGPYKRQRQNSGLSMPSPLSMTPSSGTLTTFSRSSSALTPNIAGASAISTSRSTLTEGGDERPPHLQHNSTESVSSAEAPPVVTSV